MTKRYQPDILTCDYCKVETTSEVSRWVGVVRLGMATTISDPLDAERHFCSAQHAALYLLNAEAMKALGR